MPGSYPAELRVRVVRFVEEGESRHQAAEHFAVSVSSAIRWVQRFRDSGTCEAMPRGGSTSPLEKHAKRILALINEQRDFTLDEVHGISISTMGGNDVVLVDSRLGAAKIDGGWGNDTLVGGNGNDTIYGGGGNDTITAGSGNDHVDAGDGNDTVFGGAGSDIINGGTGDDSLHGDDDNDVIMGGVGNDFLYGGNGNDQLISDDGTTSGNDTLYGGGGIDAFFGGAGNDVIHAKNGNKDYVDGGPGNDSAQTDAIDTVVSVETVTH